MKTIHAPNTTAAYVDLVRDAAVANPAAAFVAGVVVLAAICYVLRDWF